MSDPRTTAQSPTKPTGVALLAALTVGLAFLLVGSASGQEPKAVGDGKDAKTEFHESFKGVPENPERWDYVGPGAKKCVLFEPGGLRITLSTGFSKVRGLTGLSTQYPIHGDFEITVSFEILQETEEETAAGFASSRLALAVHLATPANDIHGVSRALAQNTGRFVAWHVWNEAGKQKTDPKVELSEAKTGRLRVVRKGASVSYYAAEGTNRGFKLLYESPDAEGDVKEIRITAQTGGPKASIDARITDLRIRTGSVPITPVADPPEPRQESQSDPRWRLWLGAAIVAIVIVIFLSTWLYWRQRDRAGKKAADVSVADEQAKSEAASSFVSFKCVDCGKNLKVKAALAGNKFKCPQCGKAVLVPATKARESEHSS